MGLGTAALVGGALVGGIAGSKKQGGGTTTTSPWGPQQEYLKHGFEQGKTALTDAQALGTYEGPYTAEMNPFQTQGLNGTAAFAQNQATQGSNALLGLGNSNLNFANQFGQNANSMFGMAGQDPTQQIIGNAGQYANNPYLDGMIDAASRDVNRNLYEQQLPGLDMAAASSGNMNSSRTGVAEGIMQRGAADRIADISAGLRGQAYNNGLGMAQSQYNAGIGQQMAANGQLLQAGSMGADALANGVTMGFGANSALTNAGAAFQAQNQAEIDGERQKLATDQSTQLDLLQKYMGIVGGNYGSTTTAPKTGGGFMGALSGALGGAGMMGSFMGPAAAAIAPGALGSGTFGMMGSAGNAVTPLGGSPFLSMSRGLGSGLSNVGASGVLGSGW